MAKTGKVPGPFDTTAHKTEWTGAAILMYWMRNIIEQKQLDLGLPDVETTGADKKRPDAVIYESRRSQKVLCVIEAKLPFFDVFNEDLKDKARKKATRRKAKYFVTTNFRKLVWWKTHAANEMLPEEQQIAERYSLSEIEDLDEIEHTSYSEPIKRELEEFLTKLYAVYTGEEPEPKQAVDEFLVLRLHEKNRVLSNYYKRIIEDRCHKDSAFARKLTGWFVEQGWSFAWHPQDFDKAARQTAYLLVNKILFYCVLQAKRPDFPPLRIQQGLVRGAQLRKILQSFFDEVLKIDYQTIYTADFIDSTAFPDAKEVVSEIGSLVGMLEKYDFSKLGYDIVGRIFERLIPGDERHNLGQYFTRADVVDLILRFCLRYEDDKVLDPACGAGTFLVRAYQHKKLMNQRKGHEEILESLWGNDIAKFPAHLSTINLAINDLAVDHNYPNIIQEDFFALPVGNEGFDLPASVRKRRAVTLGIAEREVTYPRWFDAIVGNPPYTRQEEIPKAGVDKAKLIERALKVGERRIANISRRAGIHAYFFVHGMKFLKNGGRFGFIVSNSWLDVDYGKGLQEFFLRNCKIVAVIESKVERWFPDADINTSIVILEKWGRKRERDANLVRFVYLKKPLRHFIPPAQDMWEKQVERIAAINKLIKTILFHSSLYESAELRVFPKSQKELWKEGFDPETGKYAGAKWGKYLRAPSIFFRVLEKGKGKLVPLKQVAEVRFGIKTGANEFFYLTEEEIKRKGIEKEFWMHRDKKGKWVPNYVIKSPRECKTIEVRPEDLKYRVLMIHKDKKDLKGTKVLRYIRQGERKGFDKRPTCASRKRWYDLGHQSPADGIWFKAFNDRFLAPQNLERYFSSDRFYAVYLKNRTLKNKLFLYLNSTLPALFVELNGRVSLGEGALDNMTYEAASMLILDVSRQPAFDGRIFKALRHRPIETIFMELGVTTPDEVSLDKVRPDRRELDRIVMGEILGLTEKEQLEVYRAVIDLVRSRIERAKSTGRRRLTADGLDFELLKNTIVERVREKPRR